VLATLNALQEKRSAIAAEKDAALGKYDAAIAKIEMTLLDAAMLSERVDDVVAVYIAKRDAKEQLADQTKRAAANINGVLSSIERWFLEYFSRTGQESAKCKTGTAYTKNVSSAKVDDREAFFSWVGETESFDMLEARCSKLAVEAYLDSNGELPPGVSRRVEKVVSINRPQAKH
jgi:hypothetical protein